MKKNFFVIITLIVLCLLITSCVGNGSSESSGSEEAKNTETEKQEQDFLIGSWFAKEASKDGVTKDPEEVFGDTFSLYFSDDGKCTMYVGDKHALVDWERTDSGVTLTGDNTYQITFPDDTEKELVININGIDVNMEKYEE